MILPMESRVIKLEAEITTIRQDLKELTVITKNLNKVIAEINEDHQKFTKLIMDEVFKKEPE
tara:strand:- start:11 stop:196 length:186 start_codon:yes stop_codon:yes gene_type:complete